jgi:hypothetical protein
MLTLDETTLFYHSLSHASQSRSTAKLADVNNWVDKVASTQSGAKSGKKATSATTPPLTTESSKRSASTTTNVTSYKKLKSSHHAEVLGSEDELIILGGLSDHDETTGGERDAAVLSPPKGKQRVTSNVSLLFWLYGDTTISHYRPLSKLKITPSRRERQ